jgi:hypothetical protein
VKGDREERRVLEGEASEDERHLDKVSPGLIGRWQCLDVSLEEAEGAHAERGDQPVLDSNRV